MSQLHLIISWGILLNGSKKVMLEEKIIIHRCSLVLLSNRLNIWNIKTLFRDNENNFSQKSLNILKDRYAFISVQLLCLEVWQDEKQEMHTESNHF